jgi:hypothetical protein
MADPFVAQIDGHTFLSEEEVAAYYTWLAAQGGQDSADISGETK